MTSSSRRAVLAGLASIGVLARGTASVAQLSDTETKRVELDTDSTPVTYRLTDQQFQSLPYQQAFVARDRVGVLLGYERSIGPTVDNPAQTAFQEWSNGETRPFTLRYTRSSNQAQFVNQNGNAVSYSPSNRGPYNDLFIRIRGASNGTMTISNLTLNGSALSDSLSISNGIRVLRITNVPFASGFVLQGSARMTWTGSKPSANNQYVELRVGQVT
jgi:hypothetical protein